MSAILRIEGLDASYADTQALYGMALAVEEHGITALLGANGAGKTTTLRAICRTEGVRTTGRIEFCGERIDTLPTEEIVRRGIAHVPDGRGTFTALSVEENLRLGAYLRRDKAAVATDFERCYHYFPKLLARRSQQAGTLSGGEQQMLAISRALMLRPKLLVLDEPSFGLAPLIVKEIFSILAAINQSERTSILIVEQNANLALELADQACLLEIGKVVRSGKAALLRSDEQIRRAYLGMT